MANHRRIVMNQESVSKEKQKCTLSIRTSIELFRVIELSDLGILFVDPQEMSDQDQIGDCHDFLAN